MTDKTTPPKLTTPEEVLQLGEHRKLENIRRAAEVYEASKKEYQSRGETELLWILYKSLANVYDAGFIQGKREERQKRRA